MLSDSNSGQLENLLEACTYQGELCDRKLAIFYLGFGYGVNDVAFGLCPDPEGDDLSIMGLRGLGISIVSLEDKVTIANTS